MNYEFDVFLSYSRASEWPSWVKRSFMPIFHHWLTAELGRDARIFVDFELDTGVSWPSSLGRALARSTVLVPLWSRNYFTSDWCKCEMAQMRAREDRHGYRSPGKPLGLIIPAIVHDGDTFPDVIADINHINISSFSNVRMDPNGVTAERLSQAIKDWVPSVVKAIETAPAYDNEWDQLDANAFVQQFSIRARQQLTVPRLV
jgi:hypothetical protein